MTRRKSGPVRTIRWWLTAEHPNQTAAGRLSAREQMLLNILGVDEKTLSFKIRQFKTRLKSVSDGPTIWMLLERFNAKLAGRLLVPDYDHAELADERLAKTALRRQTVELFLFFPKSILSDPLSAVHAGQTPRAKLTRQLRDIMLKFDGRSALDVVDTGQHYRWTRSHPYGQLLPPGYHALPLRPSLIRLGLCSAVTVEPVTRRMLEALRQMMLELGPEEIPHREQREVVRAMLRRINPKVSIETYYRRLRRYPVLRAAVDYLVPNSRQRLERAMTIIERQTPDGRPMNQLRIAALASTDAGKIFWHQHLRWRAVALRWWWWHFRRDSAIAAAADQLRAETDGWPKRFYAWHLAERTGLPLPTVEGRLKSNAQLRFALADLLVCDKTAAKLIPHLADLLGITLAEIEAVRVELGLQLAREAAGGHSGNGVAPAPVSFLAALHVAVKRCERKLTIAQLEAAAGCWRGVLYNCRQRQPAFDRMIRAALEPSSHRRPHKKA